VLSGLGSKSWSTPRYINDVFRFIFKNGKYFMGGFIASVHAFKGGEKFRIAPKDIRLINVMKAGEYRHTEGAKEKHYYKLVELVYLNGTEEKCYLDFQNVIVTEASEYLSFGYSSRNKEFIDELESIIRYGK